MNRKSPFVISKFSNPSGEVVFRVSGRLNGTRVRKNFPTRAEAEAERQVLEVQCLQGQTGIRTAITRLTDGQLHEAEAAFLRLKDQPKSLSFYLEFAISNYREPTPSKPLAEAVEAYRAAKQREHDRDLLSACQLRSIRKELAALQRRFAGRALAGLTPALLAAHCDRNGGSLKTFNNRRSILSTFFKFAVQSEWAESNPIEKIPHHRIAHRRGTAKTISADQSAELMEFVEKHEDGALVPFFALCLFAGIRPCVRDGEILKLQPEHVRLDLDVIRIEPEVSKVRTKRNVVIQPNLGAWLRAYPLKKFPIIPRNIQDRRAAVADRFKLTHDVLRHTFISMFKWALAAHFARALELIDRQGQKT